MPEERIQRLWVYLTLSLLLVLSLGLVEEGLKASNHTEVIVGGMIFTWMAAGVTFEMIRHKQTDELDEELEELIADIDEFLSIDQTESATE